MQRLVTLLFGLIFLCSFVMAQETDSLLLADFENDELGLNGWGAWGDACEEVMVSADPDGEANYVIESIIDCAREGEKKGGFSTSDLSIVVDGDTATALVIYVWIFEDMATELSGYQIFSMDQSAWQWQNTWYSSGAATTESWNRLFFPFSQSFENVAGFDTLMNAGLMVGVEFVFNENSEWFGSVYGDEIYLLGVKGDVTSVEPAPTASVPGTFTLEQNYPNPFNPTTNIVYTLPQRDRVTITIYDVTGRLVTTLIDNEPQPAGRIAVPFNADGLSSGIYYYKVQTSHAAQMKKMALIR